MTWKKRRLKRAYGISTIILALVILFVPRMSQAASGGSESIVTSSDVPKTVAVVDMRANKTNTTCISASVSDQTEDLFLIVNDGDEEKSVLKGLLTEDDEGELALYDLALQNIDEEEYEDDCIITLPVDSAWDTENGTIKVLSVDPDTEELQEVKSETVKVGDVVCAKFTAEHFSEYALHYTMVKANGGASKSNGNGTETGNTSDVPSGSSSASKSSGSSGNKSDIPADSSSGSSSSGSSSSGSSGSSSSSSGGSSSSSAAKTYSLTIKDERTDKKNTEVISATVTTLSQNLQLHIKDSEGPTLKGLLTLQPGEKAAYYEITLTDEKGKAVTDFGSCTVIMPIPADMDTSKGTVKVVTVNSDKKAEVLNSSIVGVSGVKCVCFTTTHFSEYGIIYTPGSSSGGRGNNANDMPRTGDNGGISILIAMFCLLSGSIAIISSFSGIKRREAK